MYLTISGQEEEVFIGYIEAWLILKPGSQGGSERNNDWIRLLDPTRNYPQDTRETAHGLQSLYDPDGTVNRAIEYKGTSEVRADGTDIHTDLGPTGTELVYISAIWIDHNYSGNGIGAHALNLFYRSVLPNVTHHPEVRDRLGNRLWCIT